MSHGWRGILIRRDLLLQNIGWVIGDGQSVNIWNDPWLSLNRQERPMGPPPHPELSATLFVLDLMIEGSNMWDRERIQRLLPAYEEKILCLQPSITGAPDRLVWIGTKSGEYSVKSGYYVALGEDNTIPQAEANFNWRKHVWNRDCAPKIKHFVWKVLKRALPVGECLVARHIDVDPTCNAVGASNLLLICSSNVGMLRRFGN